MANTESNDLTALSAAHFPLHWSKSDSTLNRSQDLLRFNHQWLSPGLIDALGEAQQNWINLVQHDWFFEVYSLNLLGVSQAISGLKHSCVTIEEIVELTAQASYRRTVVSEQAYYCYTCCLHIAGLGRVRLVVAFDNAEQTGNYGVLLTNCLAWSSQKVLGQWLEDYSPDLLLRCYREPQQSYPRLSAVTRPIASPAASAFLESATAAHRPIASLPPTYSPEHSAIASSPLAPPNTARVDDRSRGLDFCALV